MSDRVARLAQLRKQRDGEPAQELNLNNATSEKPRFENQGPTTAPSSSPEAIEESKQGTADDAMEEDNGYNSDLKRDIAPYLAKAERRTEAAINRYILKSYLEKQEAATQGL